MNKRRRKGNHYLSEVCPTAGLKCKTVKYKLDLPLIHVSSCPTCGLLARPQLSCHSAPPAGEDGELRENKVRSMATQLLAKFEENSSTALMRSKVRDGQPQESGLKLNLSFKAPVLQLFNFIAASFSPKGQKLLFVQNETNSECRCRCPIGGLNLLHQDFRISVKCVLTWYCTDFIVRVFKLLKMEKVKAKNSFDYFDRGTSGLV